MENRTICSRCIYDDRLPGISFDEQGVCNYCHMVDQLKDEYKTGQPEGEANFLKFVEEIKLAGRGKPYDCIIGVSGGTDSSFLIHLATTKWGLRPLAVHYDNTWNSAIATENIRKVLTKAKVDLYTHVVDNKEMDDIFGAFLKADVPEIDAPTDIGAAELLYRACSKYNIKYLIEGHSYIAEGISPLGKNYFDGKYVKSIHKMFGKVKMKTFPNMDFLSFMKWTLVKRIRKIRPFWYIQYSKEDARVILERDYNWTYYGGHHLENRWTAFNHSFYFPNKFNIDYRNNSLSASVRNHKMSREDAINEYYNKKPHLEPELLAYVKKRMNLSDQEFEEMMSRTPKYWYQYPTYKRRFELLRPLFYMLYKKSLVPKSFYLKYCFPVKFEK